MNTRDSDLEIELGASPEVNNIEFFREGWKTRAGITKKHTTALGSEPINGIFDGFNDILVAEGTNLREWDGTTFTAITGATTLANNAIPAFASYNALDIMVNGSANDNPKSWDGATFQDLTGSPPKADDVTVWRNHVWLTGLASPNQDEVRFSQLEDPTIWPSGHFLRPSKRAKGRNLICSRVCPYPGSEDGTRLVVFASDAIFHFDGFTKSLFQIYPVQSHLGSISKRGVVIAENLTYWVDENGIYCSPDGCITVNHISWNIQPTFDALNKSRLNLCCGVHHRYKRQIWWSFSNTTSSTHNIVLVYNYGLSTPMAQAGQPGARHVWSKLDLQLNAFGEILTSNEYLVYGGASVGASSNGFVYTVDNGTTDAGTAISWTLRTKRILLGGSWSVYNVLRKLSVIHDALGGATMSVKFYSDTSRTVTESTVVDLAGGGSLFGTGLFGTAVFGSSGTMTSEIWFNRMVAAIQFEFSGSDSGKLLRCYEIAMEVLPKRGMR